MPTGQVRLKLFVRKNLKPGPRQPGVLSGRSTSRKNENPDLNQANLRP